MMATLKEISRAVRPSDANEFDSDAARTRLENLTHDLYENNFSDAAARFSRYLLEGGTLDQAFGLSKPQDLKPGPEPKKELLLARAVQAVSILPKESRPTMDEIAATYDVGKRQLQLAHAKHKERVECETNDQLVEELTRKLADYDAMEPEEQRRYDQKLDQKLEKIESLIEYEQSLILQRKAFTKRRSRKRRSS